MALPAVSVELVADRPDLLEQLARIRWTDWGDEPGRETLEWWIDDLRAEAGRDSVPVAFAAIGETGDVIGGVSLAAFA